MAKNKQPDYLGEFEQLVLLAVLQLRSDAYGMTIRRELQERIGRRASLGAIYTTLDRMEAKGFVSSWTGDPTPERGGRAKRFFKIQADGKAALRGSLQAAARMLHGLESELGVAL